VFPRPISPAWVGIILGVMLPALTYMTWLHNLTLRQEVDLARLERTQTEDIKRLTIIVEKMIDQQNTKDSRQDERLLALENKFYLASMKFNDFIEDLMRTSPAVGSAARRVQRSYDVQEQEDNTRQGPP
jgi:hypothetical protein